MPLEATTYNMADARVNEVGVVIELIMTLRLYIVTDLRKLRSFFKAIFLLDAKQHDSLASIFSYCRDDGDNQLLEVGKINLCLEVDYKCT